MMKVQRDRDEFGDQLHERAMGHADLPPGPIRRRENSLDIPSGVPGLQFTYMFREYDTEVALYLLSKGTSRMGTYDRLLASRTAIEAAFGGTLDWLARKPGQQSRIRFMLTTGGYEHRERWPMILSETLGAMTRLYRAIVPHIAILSSRSIETQPTADLAELDRRVARLWAWPDLPRPAGHSSPERVVGQRSTYVRDPQIVAWVLQQARGRCELCGQEAPFIRPDGRPYLEVHHLQALSEDGPDVVENAVALCPNCHRRLHHGSDAEQQRARLYAQIERLAPLPTSTPE